MSRSRRQVWLKQRLQERLRGQFQIVEQSLQIGSISLAFTRVIDPDVVLDQIAQQEDLRERLSGSRTVSDQLHLPYWAELWDSAFAIAAWVGGQPANRERDARVPRTVLDLGCGMGLAGTAAAAAGHRVLFADLEPPALLFARLNSAPWRTRVRARRLDWRIDQLDERFDLILGADILYERKQWEFLEPFWRHHLEKEGTVLLGEPGRQTGELFVDWIRARGWTLTESLETVVTRAKPIRLFHLTTV